jgi:hypothetical protein
VTRRQEERKNEPEQDINEIESERSSMLRNFHNNLSRTALLALIFQEYLKMTEITLATPMGEFCADKYY